MRWISEPDEGQSDALNKGFRMAKGEILAWINSDDYYEPHAIKTVVEVFMKHPELSLVYGDCNYIYETTEAVQQFKIGRKGKGV